MRKNAGCLAALVIFVFLILSPIALADATITFTSTGDFDAGTKTTIETTTDTCNQQTTSHFGLKSSPIDYHGIATTCKAGAAISETSLSSSYNMETASAGKLKDFTGSNDCTNNGGTTIGGATGTYGQATTFDGVGMFFSCTQPTTPASFTWHALIKSTATGKIVMSFDSGGSSYMYFGVASSVACNSQAGAQATATASTGTYWTVDCVLNGSNNTINIYLNGIWKASTASASPQAWNQMQIGKHTAGAPLFFTGDIDEVSVWTRALTGAEILHLATDGRGKFSTSGNWLSASQSATGELFSSITVVYDSASASNYIAAVSLVDSTNFYFFIDNTHIISGTSKTYTVPSKSNSHTWKVQVNLTGAASGTVNVDSVSIGTTTKLPCALGSIGVTLDVLIPILVGAGLIIFAFGFLVIGLESRGSSKKSFSVELLIVGAIGLVVAITVTAAVISSMHVC